MEIPFSVHDDEPRRWLIDLLFIKTSPAFERTIRLKMSLAKITETTSGIEPKWFEIYGCVTQTGKSERFTEEFNALGICFNVFAFRIGEPKENRLAVWLNGISAQKIRPQKTINSR